LINAGGVDVYVLDTGINYSNPEFEGRAKQQKDYVNEVPVVGNFHGTFVAGLVGGKLVGVAKKVNLIGMKVSETYFRFLTIRVQEVSKEFSRLGLKLSNFT
jgi:subtilase-type proteinase RRT12